MKKLLLPTILILVLAVGGYFVFFVDQNEENKDGKETVEMTDEQENTSEEEPKQPTEEELKKQKRLMEHARPQEFIDLRYSSKRNIVGESVIEGSFLNNAELTTYNDLRLMIYFENEDGDPVDSASQVVFGTMAPGEKVDFRLKEKGPRKTEVRLDLVEADVIEK